VRTTFIARVFSPSPRLPLGEVELWYQRGLKAYAEGNSKRAIRWLRKAAADLLETIVKSGNFSKNYLLAHEKKLLSLDPSRLLPEDAREAYREGEKALEAGDLPAATTHFIKAARAGHARARLATGLCLGKVEGASKASAQWFKMAAEQGCIRASMHFGAACFLGEGAEKNEPLALEHLNKVLRVGFLPVEMLAGVEWLIHSDEKAREGRKDAIAGLLGGRPVTSNLKHPNHE
jgi:tetratricopeptide (TPR) repeat protein